MLWRTNLMVLVALLLATAAFGQIEERRHYYQFRQTSSLPGNLFGVQPDGTTGFDGAFQQNVPVTYTPSWGNVVVNFAAGSEKRNYFPTVDGANVNGTATVGFGLSSKQHPIYFSDMITGRDLCTARNIQVRLLPETSRYPAIAIGMQDIGNRREAIIGRPHGARSVYITMTRKAGSEKRPLYLTLGIGNGRFNNSPFGGVSWLATDHFTLVGEYDGFQANAGIAYGVQGRQKGKPWNGMFYLGLTELYLPIWGGGVTYNF